jgi:NAD(P)H dehydrogenase (quinone)
MPQEPNVDPVTPFVGVTTASGQTGRYLIREFARRGIRVRGLVRSTRAADAAREAGAFETAQADLADRESMAAALAGLDLLVFIAPPFDGREDAHAADALAAAGRQGVGHFVYYSVLHPSFRGVPHHLRKLEVETQVKDSSLRWTIIQPTMYQQTFLGLVRQATDGVLRLPYSPAARFHLVDLQDVAHVVGEVAVDPDRHVYATYELAGPDRLSSTEMAERVAQATGRHLRVEELPTTSFPLPPGLPRTTIAEMLAMFAKYDRAGYPASANVLRLLLGREPTPLATVAQRELPNG